MTSKYEPLGALSDQGKIALHQAKDAQTTVDVQLGMKPFGYVFEERGLPKQSNMQKMHIALLDKPVPFYTRKSGSKPPEVTDG